jgi:hypothetical protein
MCTQRNFPHLTGIVVTTEWLILNTMLLFSKHAFETAYNL